MGKMKIPVFENSMKQQNKDTKWGNQKEEIEEGQNTNSQTY